MKVGADCARMTKAKKILIARPICPINGATCCIPSLLGETTFAAPGALLWPMNPAPKASNRKNTV